MARHGSEIDHVLGEGPTAFRFSRMGPDGKDEQLDDRTLASLALNMTFSGGSAVETTGVPAGYTYLGQFIAHDLSFDKTSVTLGANVSPSGLDPGKVPEPRPRLALRGRAAGSGVEPLLRAGRDPPQGGNARSRAAAMARRAGFDLPRGAGSKAAERRKAVIADERNDDNLAVAQTHLAFIRFHNRVVDTLPASVPEALRFARARELVTKHYQWMIRSDYLPRICAETVLDDVFTNGRRAFEAAAEPTDLPTMPIEFSVAAFRLGHSMVRDVYKWNRLRETVMIGQLFEFSAKSGDLGGKDRLPSDMIADFRRLYDLGAIEPNFAMRIDTRLISFLRAPAPGQLRGAGRAARGSALEPRVPQPDARADGQAGQRAADGRVPHAGLRREARPRSRGGRSSRARTAPRSTGSASERKKELVERTPLWFYILREAECNGGKLNGVGAQIVAETFHRAIEGSSTSIVRDPAWHPTFGRSKTRFRMADLLRFAAGGNPHVIAPLEQDPPPA